MSKLLRISVALVLWNHVLWWSWIILLAERFSSWMLPASWVKDGAWASRIAQFCWGRALFLTNPFWRVRVEGAPPLEGPVIYCMNHQSLLDVPVSMAAGIDARYVADQRWFVLPLFGPFLRRKRTVPAVLNNPFVAGDTLRMGAELLANNTSIFVFPEGTRTRDGELGNFHQGPFRLACKERVPIVPVVIDGTGKTLPPDTSIPPLRAMLQGCFQIRFLEPIPPPDPGRGDAGELRDRVRHAIDAGLTQLRGGPSLKAPRPGLPAVDLPAAQTN